MDRSSGKCQNCFQFFQPITSLLPEMGASRTRRAKTHVNVSGLLIEVQKQRYLFIAKMRDKISLVNLTLLPQLFSNNL